MSHLNSITQREVIFVPQNVIVSDLGRETFYEEAQSYTTVRLSEIKKRLAKR